jgi:enoyl-CoA hydratase
MYHLGNRSSRPSGQEHCVRAAVARRDGPFGDYSQAGKGEQPDPGNVIMP